ALVSRDVEVSVGVEESAIGQIHEGQTVALTTAAYPGREFPAKVATIAPTADQRTRTFTVKIWPDSNDGTLREGMFAQVRITAQERQGVLVLPNEAITSRLGKTVVFVIDNNQAKQREVTVGVSDGKRSEIVSGLNDGEVVASSAIDTLNDGD